MNAGELFEVIVLIAIMIIPAIIRSSKLKRRKEMLDNSMKDESARQAPTVAPDEQHEIITQNPHKVRNIAISDFNNNETTGNLDGESALVENDEAINFDIKKAIIYSEILNPKFKEK